MSSSPRVAEFFAGIGLMRAGLEGAGFEVVWANDIEPRKHETYVANFGEDEYRLGDVRDVRGDDVPDIELATGSFPCTDLSLAGYRGGLGRSNTTHVRRDGSSMFWEFARVLDEMGSRRPGVVLLENVPGFATSAGGRDLVEALAALNALGYSCDLVGIDARHFVPQSRMRLFIIGLQTPTGSAATPRTSTTPKWLSRAIETARSAGVRLHHRELPPLPPGPASLEEIVDRLEAGAEEWWDADRVSRFVASLSAINHERLRSLAASDTVTYRTAYRRTRNGHPVWEIRNDGISGCLRTTRGGSSKQALVEASARTVRVRWMTASEYARLMGAPRFKHAGNADALFGFGDAVCVPVIQWLGTNYLAIETSIPQRPLALAC